MNKATIPLALALCCALDAQITGAITAAGRLTRLRQFHTATLLTNGKVLITGGFSISDGWVSWNSTEEFDPATRQFRAAGNMNTPRYFHTATLLPGGKVLLAGGNTSVEGGCFCSPTSSACMIPPQAHLPSSEA